MRLDIINNLTSEQYFSTYIFIFIYIYIVSASCYWPLTKLEGRLFKFSGLEGRLPLADGRALFCLALTSGLRSRAESAFSLAFVKLFNFVDWLAGSSRGLAVLSTAPLLL